LQDVGAGFVLIQSAKNAFELPDKIEYVELSGRADFNDSFVSVLAFPELETLR